MFFACIIVRPALPSVALILPATRVPVPGALNPYRKTHASVLAWLLAGGHKGEAAASQRCVVAGSVEDSGEL
jgi:hypothetical protein